MMQLAWRSQVMGPFGFALVGQTLRFRGCLGTLWDFADFPVPFFWVHFVHLLTVIYLPLFAYMTATKYTPPAGGAYGERTVLGFVLVVMNATFVLGLTYIGRSFADPFGTELEDLSVLSFVSSTLRGSRTPRR